MKNEEKKLSIETLTQNAYNSGKSYGHFEVIELVSSLIGKEKTQSLCDKLGILVPSKIQIVAEKK